MALNNSSNPLPREIAPRVFWMGDCLHLNYRGQQLHGYNSVYLVAGQDASALIESGPPQDLEVIESQLESLLADGLPPLRFVFLTHHETPHAAGAGRLLERFEDLQVVGGVMDLHLAFPKYAERFEMFDPGDRIDLGGTELVTVESVIRDMPYTRWAFETSGRVLFPGDGFAYAHYHAAGQCGHLAEEADTLDLPDMTAMFAEAALYWTRFVDLDPYIDRLDLMIKELDVQVVAPTHGLPIADLDATMPRIRQGMRLGAERKVESQIS